MIYMYIYIYIYIYIKRKLVCLKSWLVNRGYRAERVRPEIQKIKLIDQAKFLIKKNTKKTVSH